MTGWLTTTTRWGQVNLNEADVLTFDADLWKDYWKRSAIQGVTLNAGGVVAYYPTNVALHRRAHGVDRRDVFGVMVDAAKSLGLRVLGRLDLSVGTTDLHAAHPDWFQTKISGEPLTRGDGHGGAPDPIRAAAYALGPTYYRTCPVGPYLSEFVATIAEEVLTGYDVDGLFANGWPLLGQGVPAPASVCHCPHCRAAWVDRHGETAQLPRAAGDPRWRSYVEMLQDALEKGQSLLASRTAAIKPGATFLPVAFPVPGTGLRWKRWAELVDIVCADAQTRRTLGSPPTGPAALWEPGLQAELLRSVAGGKPVLRFCGTYSNPPIMRQSAKSPLEMRLLMAQSLAHGERPKWHTVGGHSYDRRWMEPIAEYGTWMAGVEPELANVASIADVAIVWSQSDAWSERWNDDGETKPLSAADALSGWYAALLLARIPAELVHDDHLGRLDNLDRFRAVIVPSGTVLSPEAAADLVAFHRRGGAVVGCCAAQLADVFGIEPGVTVTGPHPHSYLKIRPHLDHPVFSGFEDTEIVPGGRWTAATSVVSNTQSLATWIPDYPLIPTNDVVMGAERADVATVVIRSDGARSVYLAMDIDAEFRRTESPDHRRLLANVARWAIGPRPPSVDVEGAGVVDVRVWRQHSGLTVHLVNLDTPQHAGGAVVDLRPLGQQTVSVAVPDDADVRDVRLLRSGAPVHWTAADEERRIHVSVPSVDDFEIVAVDLA